MWVTLDERVAVVTLERPPVNAMATQTYLDLAAAFEGLSERDDCSVIVLRSGSPRAFCAGADIKEVATLTAEFDERRQRAARRLFNAILEARQPVIAAVNGPALGAGCVLAAVADIVLASEQATFGLPEINVGRCGGGRHMMRVLPQGIVRWMYFTGRPLTAAEAHRWGMVREVLPDAAALDEAAMQLAAEIAGKSPIALRLAKEALNLVEDAPLVEGYQTEQQFTLRLRDTEDAKEAAAAFVEKRAPRWKG
ncbi:MAG TPA: enoyl-CoA hydratase-related protein, partial [Bacillota bacterium]